MKGTKCMKHAASFILLCMCFLGGGCQQSSRQVFQERICTGKATIQDAVAVLELQRVNIQPLRANAHCILQWQDENGKEHTESFDAQFRFLPPDKTFFRGDKFGEVRFGTNETDFWLRIKPELDTYWWGTKELAERCHHVLLINPADIAEAFGIVRVTTDWKLSHRNGTEIFDLYDDATKIKRVYVDACDYQIERIDYYDELGLVKTSVQLDAYTIGESGISCPTRIHVSYYRHGLEESSVRVELKNIAALMPTEKQRRLLFQRPGRDNYKHVYRLNENCEFIEE
jgi:hypothetical protein